MKQTNNALYIVLFRPLPSQRPLWGRQPSHYLSLHSPAELQLLDRDGHEVRGENRRKINKLILCVAWTDNIRLQLPVS